MNCEAKTITRIVCLFLMFMVTIFVTDSDFGSFYPVFNLYIDVVNGIDFKICYIE